MEGEMGEAERGVKPKKDESNPGDWWLAQNNTKLKWI